MNICMCRALAPLAAAVVAMPVSNALAEEFPFPTLKTGGGSWTYEQVSLAGIRREVMTPKFSVGYLNGHIITLLVQDAKAEPTLAQPAFSVSDEACGVDLIGGAVILAGHPCDAPLVPGESWNSTNESRGMTTSSTNTYIGRENVTVPAGTFSAYKIQGRQLFSYGDSGKANRSATATYWYVPALKAMARVERHLFDEQNRETRVMTEQLTAHTDR